jgi:ribosomal protein S17
MAKDSCYKCILVRDVVRKTPLYLLEKKVMATKQEQTHNDKLKAKIEDKGVQCNTMRSLIKDLKYEIEILQLEIDSPDENNNCNIEVSDKVFNTKTFGRGTA